MVRALRIGLLALLATSCGTEELTQLMVVVDTDFQVPGELDEVVISVQGPSGEDRVAGGPLTSEALPMRLALVHRGGPLGPMNVTVEGVGIRDGGTRGVLIQRFATVSFVEGEVRVLQMDLLRECRGVGCSASETCAAGGCREREVSEDELTPWDGPMRLDQGVPDMGSSDMYVCEPVDELCNGTDDDCDDDIDEIFDLTSDMANCGACGVACQAAPVRGSEACVDSGCVLTCDPGFADCNADEPGCESELTSPDTCGSCDQSCSGATPVCDVDTCVADCPEGSTRCGDSCIDTDSSVTDCGGCDNECADAANASPLCTEGSCAIRCDPGFFNCDGDLSNGCESQLEEVANCGACGVACVVANGTPTCATGECAVSTCSGDFANCDGDVMNGCEANLDTSPSTCGNCDTVCPLNPDNGARACISGSCGVACDPGYADCNMDPTDGCETFLGSTTSCGACGILCEATEVCSGSGTTFDCSVGCGDGQIECGTEGTCVDISTDPRYCGSCDTSCPDPVGASPTCVDGSCGFSCDAGFADCDMDIDTGCEAELGTIEHCGGCYMACGSVTDGTAGCDATEGCVVATCVGTKRDCDADIDTGCETDIDNDTANCGGCGVACAPGPRVASVSCTDGGCVIEACETGFADCDGDFATGCEQRLGTRNHCSACDDRCTGGGTNRCCDFVCGSC